MEYYCVNAKGSEMGVGTYPSDLIERYKAEGYFNIDLIVLGCLQRFHTFNWKELDGSGKAVFKFLLDETRFGRGNQGLSIPLRGLNRQYALFTVNHTCSDEDWEDIIQETQRDLIFITHIFNKKRLNWKPTQP